MEEADRILINSLLSIGLDLPDENISFEEFSPDILIGAAGLCLEFIFKNRDDVQTFPKSCPVNMAARYKVGQALAEGIKLLGYRDTIGYQSFLYPNLKETRRIISFLIENLPKDTGPTVAEALDENILKSLISSTFGDNWRSPWLPSYCQKFLEFRRTYEPTCLLIPFTSDKNKLTFLNSWFESFPCVEDQINNDFVKLFMEAENYEIKLSLLEQTIDYEQLTKKIHQINLKSIDLNKTTMKPEIRKRTKKFILKSNEHTEKLAEKNLLEEELNKTEAAEKELQDLQFQFQEAEEQYNKLMDKFSHLNNKYETIIQAERDLNEELNLINKEWSTKEKLGIILNHGKDSVSQLSVAISKRQNQIENINNQWNIHKSEMMEKINMLRSEQLDKCDQTSLLEDHLKAVKQDMEDCRMSYQDKDSEIRVLDEKVKQILKSETTRQNRNDFTKRILELTENKKKQNFEIKKILADIFVLQKDINSLRGKLERSFMETRDGILEHAKKDEVSKKMYKVLLGIHENCSNLVDVIEEKGRLLREIRDLETIIDNEDGENVEKNLNKIKSDYDEAKRNCENLKKLLSEHKINDLN